jgi:hypothetical protein
MTAQHFLPGLHAMMVDIILALARPMTAIWSPMLWLGTGVHVRSGAACPRPAQGPVPWAMSSG